LTSFSRWVTTWPAVVRGILFVLAAVMFEGSVWASDFAPASPGLAPDDVNTFHPYVAFQETYDSNLFRIPTNVTGTLSSILPNATRSDFVSTGSVGGTGQWDVGRQAVNFNVHADENRFAHNDALDFTSGDANVLWDWRVGGYFSGTAQVSYDRSLASFGETRFLGKDAVSSTDGLVSGRYQVGPHWAVFGDVRGSTVKHSAEAAQFDDFHSGAGDAAVEYATDVSDTFTAKYSYVKLTFPTDSLTTTLPLNYTEDSERLLVKYALTDKTSFDGYAGYLKRSYPGSLIGTYSGDVWRASFRWQATDKTQIAVAAYHELHAYVDAESNYFKAKGYSIAPLWNATEKLSFALLVQQENQNYIGTTNPVDAIAPGVITVGAREAKVDAGQLTCIYLPRDPVSIVFFIRHEQRSSNQYTFTYTDNLASIAATYKFR
jgi:hypothetical protein